MPYNFDDTWYGTPNYEGAYAQHLQQSQNPMTLGQVVSIVRKLSDNMGRSPMANPAALGQHAQRYDVPSTMQIPTQFMQNMVSGQVSYPRAWLKNQQPAAQIPTPVDPGIANPVDSVQQSGQVNLQPVDRPAPTGGSSGSAGSGAGGLSSASYAPSLSRNLQPTPVTQTTPSGGGSLAPTGTHTKGGAHTGGIARGLPGSPRPQPSHSWRPGF